MYVESDILTSWSIVKQTLLLCFFEDLINKHEILEYFGNHTGATNQGILGINAYLICFIKNDLGHFLENFKRFVPIFM